MTDFIEVKIKEVSKWECSYCGGEIYLCDDCKESFRLDNRIYCFADGRHLCQICCEDFEEEKDNELMAKQEMKNE